MDMRELIEAGSKKAGEQKALARFLRLAPTVLADAKAGRRGIPAPACFMLAQYLGIDPARVIAASELVTEKNEERRKVFYPFVMGRAAMIFATTALVGTIALPSDCQAHSGNLPLASRILDIMSNRRLRQIKAAFREWLMLRAFFYAT